MTDPTQPADIEETQRAFDAMKEYSVRTLDQSDVNLVVAEFERMRDKLEAVSEGRTVLIMSDDDRAKAAVDLDDATFAKWGRAVLVNLAAVHARKDGDSAGNLIAMHGVISLALAAHSFSAGEIKFKVDGVSYKDEPKGDWEVIVREQGPTEAEDALRGLLDALEGTDACAYTAVADAVEKAEEVLADGS